MTIYEFWDEIGYKPISTFWEDFSIAQRYGLDAIKDTYNNIVKYWGDDYKYFTELVLVLNHKIWATYQNDDKLARLYNTLWERAQSEFFKKYEKNKEACEYYFDVTD